MAKYNSIRNNTGLEVRIGKPTMDFVLPQLVIISGYNPSNPTWNDYVEQTEPEYRPHILLIKESIKANKLLGKTASKCANNIAFEFSDGTKIQFTWRAWADLMQSIIDLRQGYEIYM